LVGLEQKKELTWTTPLLIVFSGLTHWIPLAPTAAMPNPMTPPISECVVDTGSPTLVAKVKYTEDAITAHTMPSIRTAGLSAN
jgi:hypothetical protein